MENEVLAAGRALLAERDELKERVEALERDLSDLANRMIYDGNSVSWWHSKAKAYSAAIFRAWDAVTETGYKSDGQTELADAIRAVLDRKNQSD
jgi:hypothetical protein